MPLALNMQLPSADATETLGTALAGSLPRPLKASAVLHLQGDLGAGKTTCVRSLLRALGILRTVRSPTYTLVETYAAAAMTCIHVDLYRLSSEAEADGLGLRDLAEPDALFLIEWPEKGGAAVPRADLILRLDYLAVGRCAHAASQTDMGDMWLEKLGDDTSLRSYVANMT